MGKKRYLSIKIVILVPVFLLGIISIISNLLAVKNVQSVNSNASVIADESMATISELAAIQEKAQIIHRMALSHIIATDLNSMVKLVDDIRVAQAELDDALENYEKYVTEDYRKDYDTLLSSYEAFKKAIGNVMANSGGGNTVEAYGFANTDLLTNGTAMQDSIDSMKEQASKDAEVARENLASVYAKALFISIVTVGLSAAAIALALFSVLYKVIRPLSKTKKEITEIIKDIDNREGDLTKRVTILSNDEIAALGNGINIFMEKLQDIFSIIVSNSQKMEEVVNEVQENVKTSNNSVSDLSALTEELTATMEQMSENASRINSNADSVRQEVNVIADRTNEINDYTKKMKEHADGMENTARSNMDSTSIKVNEILTVLNKAIEDSESVKQVNSLTDDILNIASETNLLALNASIEAARAGEAGRGFAVVATQISNLATASQEAANRIQEINSVVTQAVNNLAEHANGLVEYMNESILPEFASFVESGSEYKDNATYIENVMEEFTEKTDNLQVAMKEIAESINTIANAISEGVYGVSSVADSTQILVGDMENISCRMDDNQSIAASLKQETEVFKKL